MRPVALTGDPLVQDAVGLALANLCTRRDLNLRLFVGVRTRVEAYFIRDEGGELWHCGVLPPCQQLAAYVDRVVDPSGAADLQHYVERHLDAMLSKARIAS